MNRLEEYLLIGYVHRTLSGRVATEYSYVRVWNIQVGIPGAYSAVCSIHINFSLSICVFVCNIFAVVHSR